MRITPQMLDAHLEASQSFYGNPLNHPPHECAECAHCLATAAIRDSGHAAAFIAQNVGLYWASGDVGVFARLMAAGIAIGEALREARKLEEMAV